MTKKLKPYNFFKPIEGQLYVTLCIPFTANINARREVYEDDTGNEYYDDEYEYGIDDILSYYTNKNIASDIETFKRLGWTVEEITTS